MEQKPPNGGSFFCFLKPFSFYIPLLNRFNRWKAVFFVG